MTVTPAQRRRRRHQDNRARGRAYARLAAADVLPDPDDVPAFTIRPATWVILCLVAALVWAGVVGLLAGWW